MAALKTLKDIFFYNHNYSQLQNVEGKYMFKGLVRIDHLKQEAIKWVKSYNELGKYEEHGSIDGAVKWIKSFFNITEEDLK